MGGSLAEVEDQLSSILLAVYPVGSIYMSVNNVDPGTLFGGSWVAWGSGKVPVGIDTNDTDFDTVEETGGTKSVTLTSAQSGTPAHAHGLNSHTHSVGAHSHGLNSHTHSVTAAGTISDTTPKLALQFGVNPGYSASGHSYFCEAADNNENVYVITIWDSLTHGHTFTGSAVTSGKASGNTANSTAFDTGAASGNTANNTAANASQAHTNLQPYITCYMWKRIA